MYAFMYVFMYAASLLVPDDFDLEIRGMLPCSVLASIVPCTRTGEPLCLRALLTLCWPRAYLVWSCAGHSTLASNVPCFKICVACPVE